MKAEILGCNGGVGPGLRTTCLRIDDTLLVDAGTGACELPLDAAARLSDVFLTHAHLDHTIGLAFIADNRLGRAATPLVVHGQPETIARLRAHLFNWEVWPDFAALPSAEAPTLVFTTDALAPVHCHELEFIPFPVSHTIPANGYAIRHAGGIFAFTGDTCGGTPMWNTLNGLERLDQLMIEVSYSDEHASVADTARHLTPASLATQLRSLHHRPQILLTHHKPGFEAALREQCRSALGNWHYRHLHNGEIFTV